MSTRSFALLLVALASPIIGGTRVSSNDYLKLNEDQLVNFGELAHQAVHGTEILAKKMQDEHCKEEGAEIDQIPHHRESGAVGEGTDGSFFASKAMCTWRTLDVPETYDEGSDCSNTIKMAYRRIVPKSSPPAPSPRGQLWLMQGGPGADGTAMVNEEIIEIAFSLSLDVYIWDHRGTGRSSWLGCPSTMNKEAGKMSVDNAASCAEEARSRLNLCSITHMTQTAAAHDLVTLIKDTTSRDGSDSTRIFVYGVSYGTAVGQRFLQIGGGDLVKGVILDGVMQQDATRVDTYMTSVLYSLQKLLMYCENSETCSDAYGIAPSTPSGVAGWRKLVGFTEDIFKQKNKCTAILMKKPEITQGLKNSDPVLAAKEMVEMLLQTSFSMAKQGLAGPAQPQTDFRVLFLAAMKRWATCSMDDLKFVYKYLNFMLQISAMMEDDSGQDPDQPGNSETLYINIAFSEFYWLSELERKTNKASPVYWTEQAEQLFHMPIESMLGSMTGAEDAEDNFMRPEVVKAWPTYKGKEEYVARTPTRSALRTPVVILNSYLDAATPHWAAEDVFFRMQAGPLDTSKKLVTIPSGGHGTFTSDPCAQSLVKTFMKDGIESVDESCATKDEEDGGLDWMGGFVRMLGTTDIWR